MADKPNQPNITLPQRTITITGEHSARMVQNTVRVSRIEQRAIQIAMAPPAIRDAGRRAMDRFAQATSQFEAELAQIEKEMEASGRNNNSNRRRNNGQDRSPEQRQPVLRKNSPAGQGQKQNTAKAAPDSQGGAAAKADVPTQGRNRDQGKVVDSASQPKPQAKAELKAAAVSDAAPDTNSPSTSEAAPALAAAPVAVTSAPASLESL